MFLQPVLDDAFICYTVNTICLGYKSRSEEHLNPDAAHPHHLFRINRSEAICSSVVNQTFFLVQYKTLLQTATPISWVRKKIKGHTACFRVNMIYARFTVYLLDLSGLLKILLVCWVGMKRLGTHSPIAMFFKLLKIWVRLQSTSSFMWWLGRTSDLVLLYNVYVFS
jgi:hypothetical protein